MSDSVPERLGPLDDQPSSPTSFYSPDGKRVFATRRCLDIHVIGGSLPYDGVEAIPLRPEALAFSPYPFTFHSTLRLPHGRIRDP
jgi:hypothetical protein